MGLIIIKRSFSDAPFDRDDQDILMTMAEQAMMVSRTFSCTKAAEAAIRQYKVAGNPDGYQDTAGIHAFPLFLPLVTSLGRDASGREADHRFEIRQPSARRWQDRSPDADTYEDFQIDPGRVPDREAASPQGANAAPFPDA
jgi:hypothetical protein